MHKTFLMMVRAIAAERLREAQSERARNPKNRTNTYVYFLPEWVTIAITMRWSTPVPPRAIVLRSTIIFFHSCEYRDDVIRGAEPHYPIVNDSPSPFYSSHLAASSLLISLIYNVSFFSSSQRNAENSGQEETERRRRGGRGRAWPGLLCQSWQLRYALNTSYFTLHIPPWVPWRSQQFYVIMLKPDIKALPTNWNSLRNITPHNLWIKHLL